MLDDRMKLLVSEVDAILTKLPEKVRQGLSSPRALERLHAQLELRGSHVGAHLVELLENSSVLPNPELMRVFVNSAQTLDPDSIVGWLVERAVAIGALLAVAELESYSTISTFVAREVIVLDGIRVSNSLELARGVRLEPLASLQPTFFRDQFIESPPWQPSSERRAALVRTFDHPVLLRRADDRIPDNILAIAQHQTLSDIARLFTLFKEAAPVRIARWWEHDLAIPSRSPTTGAGVTAGFEASFHPFEINGDAAQKLREWISRAQACPDQLRSVLRIVLDRLNAAKRRRNVVDRSIELGVAAEALFLRYSGEDQSELSFRLATRAAWLLGSSRAEREQVFDCFRALYDARSKAVHNGELPSKVKGLDVGEVLSQGCDLLERAIIATLEKPDSDLRHVHLG
jgi:hypothetical protein